MRYPYHRKYISSLFPKHRRISRTLVLKPIPVGCLIGIHTLTCGAHRLPVYTLTVLQIGSILVSPLSLGYGSLDGISALEQE